MSKPITVKWTKSAKIIRHDKKVTKSVVQEFVNSLPRKRENQMPGRRCRGCMTRIPNYPKGTCPKCGRFLAPAKKRGD